MKQMLDAFTQTQLTDPPPLAPLWVLLNIVCHDTSVMARIATRIPAVTLLLLLFSLSPPLVI